jgi:hypothetical protein
MLALELKMRPGVVIWYFDGAYAWSENDPAINGPGKGYLLALDANPNEIALPGLASYLSGSAEGFEAGYDVAGAAAQTALAESWKKTVCFVRSKKYLPRGLPGKRPCPGPAAPVQKLTIEGKRAMYSYEVVNELLPGERDGLEKVGELVDVKERGGERSYRLRDRSLRTYHTFDAPFSREPFPGGLVLHEVKGNKLVEIEARDYPAVTRFDDRVPGRWLNPRLPFGGVAVPAQRLEIELVEPGPGAAAAIELRWRPTE